MLKKSSIYFQALFLIVLASPLLIRGDSQRGDWYDTYQGDGWTYDTPADALLTGTTIQMSIFRDYPSKEY